MGAGGPAAKALYTMMLLLCLMPDIVIETTGNPISATLPAVLPTHLARLAQSCLVTSLVPFWSDTGHTASLTEAYDRDNIFIRRLVL
jgi:hypothetical protein